MAGWNRRLSKHLIRFWKTAALAVFLFVQIILRCMSLFGTSRHFAGPQNLVAIGGIADIGPDWQQLAR